MPESLSESSPLYTHPQGHVAICETFYRFPIYFSFQLGSSQSFFSFLFSYLSHIGDLICHSETCLDPSVSSVLLLSLGMLCDSPGINGERSSKPLTFDSLTFLWGSLVTLLQDHLNDLVIFQNAFILDTGSSLKCCQVNPLTTRNGLRRSLNSLSG